MSPARSLLTALLAGATAFAAPAFAGGDIVKCVDADGRVTITDHQCGSGVSKVLVPAAMNTAPGTQEAAVPAAPPAKLVRPGVQRVVLTAEPVTHDNFIDPRPRSKMLDRDAATLRAARTSLQVLDEARQQRVAGLN
ncbi:MAG: hypothetical protein JWP59_3417 [Massilia sp.]|nr:hypothetical protein [Massilia sp.]